MNKSIKFVVGSLITFILLYYLFKDIPLSDISEVSANFSIGIILLTFLTYLAMNLFRAVRIKRIFPSMRFRNIVNIVFIHNMINNLIPFRIGELSYIYMLKKEKHVSHAISSLMMLRLTDLIAIFIIFIFALLFVKENPVIKQMTFYVSILVLISILFIVFIKRAKFLKIKLVKKVVSLLKEYDHKKISWLIFDALFIWLLSFLFYFEFIKALGIDLTFFQVTIAAILIILSSILPINGIAGLGTTELAWVIGLLIFDVEKNLALVSGLIIHLFRILYFSVLGLYGFGNRSIKST